MLTLGIEKKRAIEQYWIIIYKVIWFEIVWKQTLRTHHLDIIDNINDKKDTIHLLKK